MLPPNIRQPTDLITSHEAIRDGFLKQALTKTRKADPYIVEARELAAMLEGVTDIQALASIQVKGIRNALIAAAGFSDKARGKMTEGELEAALGQVLQTIAESAPNEWRTELVYRFLLTRGDTLGGSMRNVTGAAGGIQLTRAIVAALEMLGVTYRITHAPRNREKVVSLEWPDRLLVFDKKPRFLDNNIDAILLDIDAMPPGTVTLEQPAAYLACGELKGGIDPAGADEHWKTARSALERLRDRFMNREMKAPALFFVGAAIEKSMADEIFSQLQEGRLSCAANLTIEQQLADLVNWLIRL